LTLQVPALQVSAPLQNTPSSQGSVLLGWMQAPRPLQISVVQTLPSSPHGVVIGWSQVSPTSSQMSPHSAPPAQGSPELTHAPAAQVSIPEQNKLSLHGNVLSVVTHAPVALHCSVVQTLPSSEHGVPAVARHVSSISLQLSTHSTPPAQGSPTPTQAPTPLQTSA
jgi:hypothetical protein